MTPKQLAIDFVERVGAAFVFYFASDYSVIHTSYQVALDHAGFSALVAAITTVAGWLAGLQKITNPYIDLAVRVVLQFTQGLLGAVPTAGTLALSTFPWGPVLRSCTTATVPTLLKGIAGLGLAGTKGASMAVPKDPPPKRKRAARKRKPSVPAG